MGVSIVTDQTPTERRLGRHPWLVALFAITIQLVPTFVYFARTGGESQGSVLADMWPGLAIAAVLLIGLVMATGWVRLVGLVSPPAGWWKWYVLPVAWVTILAVVGRQVDWGEPESMPLVSLVAVLLLVAFNEELVFRGFLLRSFRTRLPLIGAVVTVSALFALLHTGTPGESVASLVVTIGAVFSLAVLQAALLIVGGSLVPVIAFHFWWDLMVFSGGGIELGSEATPLSWGALIATVIMSLGYGSSLLWRTLSRPSKLREEVD
jgi:membrane protease YdiL (CAAX protease family)